MTLKLFRCRICGDPYLGSEPPSFCPFCGAPQRYMVPAADYVDRNDVPNWRPLPGQSGKGPGPGGEERRLLYVRLQLRPRRPGQGHVQGPMAHGGGARLPDLQAPQGGQAGDQTG